MPLWTPCKCSDPGGVPLPAAPELRVAFFPHNQARPWKSDWRKQGETMNYSDMHALLNQDPEARHYFDGLPDYVRDQISTRAGNVKSFESLRNYAENLLRMDD